MGWVNASPHPIGFTIFRRISRNPAFRKTHTFSTTRELSALPRDPKHLWGLRIAQTKHQRWFRADTSGTPWDALGHRWCLVQTTDFMLVQKCTFSTCGIYPAPLNVIGRILYQTMYTISKKNILNRYVQILDAIYYVILNLHANDAQVSTARWVGLGGAALFAGSWSSNLRYEKGGILKSTIQYKTKGTVQKNSS